MMTKDEVLGHAETCARFASEASDPDKRKIWLHMQSLWLNIAKFVDQPGAVSEVEFDKLLGLQNSFLRDG
jgi:hypothetical protein